MKNFFVCMFISSTVMLSAMESKKQHEEHLKGTVYQLHRLIYHQAASADHVNIAFFVHKTHDPSAQIVNRHRSSPFSITYFVDPSKTEFIFPIKIRLSQLSNFYFIGEPKAERESFECSAEISKKKIDRDLLIYLTTFYNEVGSKLQLSDVLLTTFSNKKQSSSTKYTITKKQSILMN